MTPEEKAKASLAAKRKAKADAEAALAAKIDQDRRDVPPGIEETAASMSLREKVATVQQQVGTIAKNGENPHFKSRYATLDEIWEQIKGFVKAARLAVYCTTEGTGEEWTLTTHLADLDSPDEICARFPIPPKGSPQQIGSAITYARRYTLCALLQIVTADEDDDGNAATPAAKPSAPPNPGF